MICSGSSVLCAIVFVSVSWAERKVIRTPTSRVLVLVRVLVPSNTISFKCRIGSDYYEIYLTSTSNFNFMPDGMLANSSRRLHYQTVILHYQAVVGFHPHSYLILTTHNNPFNKQHNSEERRGPPRFNQLLHSVG